MELESFLFMILLSQILPFSTQDDNRSLASTCPEKFYCGELGFLSFPFTNLSYLDCGLCMADCSHKAHPNISFHYPWDHWYEAKSVGNSTINLSSPYLKNLLSKRSCKTFIFDIPNSPSISYTILGNITLFRCPSYPNLSYQFPGLGKYGECPGSTIYYRFPNTTYHTPESVPPCSVYHLPSNTFFTHNNESIVHDVFDLLDSEFVLEWNVSKDCYDCHSKGGNCGTNWPFHCSIDESIQSSLGNGNKRLGIIVGSAGAALVLLGLAIFLFWHRKKGITRDGVGLLRWKAKEDRKLEAFIKQYGSLAPKWYPYSEIKKMTSTFRDKLGQGGYGTVYKGRLSDGRLVAVKVINVAKEIGEEFINEVLSISRTSHINVVTLLGFCLEGEKRILVYEYMPNGSLEKYIHRKQNSIQLGLDRLYQISLGVARGLEYLHRGCNTRILHFDIKPHNVLLDEDFCPKISDFGLAKQCTNDSIVSSLLGPRGTIGYIAPELVSRSFGAVTYKSDVYSYGMMILEIVGQRKNIDLDTSHTSEIYFPHWAYQHLVINNDLRLKGIVTPEEDEIAKKMILVGLWCIQNDPSQRPTISKVIEMLQGSMQALEIPPKPFFGSP